MRYDIFGSDNAVANKMESEGEKGKINVSLEVKELIEANFDDF